MSETRPAAHEEELADDEILWRRVNPTLVKRDESGVQPMSGVFLDSQDAMSLIRAAETDPQAALAAYPGWGMVELTAGQLRSIASLEVIADPLENDKSHALAKGKVSKREAKRLRAAATWVVEPDQVDE